MAIDLINQKISFFDDDELKPKAQQRNHVSLLEEYLHNPKLDLADIFGMASDMLLAGIDTVCSQSHLYSAEKLLKFRIHPQTTYSSSLLLYHIARNPHVQQKLFDEIRTVLPGGDADEITVAHLQHQIPYTRAVLKELFRINPVSVGVGRTTNSDLILSGYNVPKGVSIYSSYYDNSKLIESPNFLLADNHCDTKLCRLPIGMQFC